MKISEILTEYKNKYYLPVPKKPKKRGDRTLWYDNYDNWVGEIQNRFPDARAHYDEEREEIVATSDDQKECYGKWSKKKKGDYKGVTFAKTRDPRYVNRNHKRLKRMEDPIKIPDDEKPIV